MSNDSPTGHDRAPDRYSGQGRETIDRMRDLAHEMFGEPGLADDVFAFHCIATALKYADRYGKKDATEIEEKKLAWYLAMAEHVIDGTPDPRSERADFVPWEHEIITPDGIPATVLRVARRLLGISADAAPCGDERRRVQTMDRAVLTRLIETTDGVRVVEPARAAPSGRVVFAARFGVTRG